MRCYDPLQDNKCLSPDFLSIFGSENVLHGVASHCPKAARHYLKQQAHD